MLKSNCEMLQSLVRYLVPALTIGSRNAAGPRAFIIVSALLGGLLMACGGGDDLPAGTRFEVHVESELAFGQQVVALRARAMDPKGGGAASMGGSTGAKMSELEVGVTARTSSARFDVHRGELEDIRLEVAGLDAAGKVLVLERVDLHFMDACALRLDVKLRSICAGKTCPMDESCDAAGACMPVAKSSRVTVVGESSANRACTMNAGAGTDDTDPATDEGTTPVDPMDMDMDTDMAVTPANPCDQPGETRCGAAGATNIVQRCDPETMGWVEDEACGTLAVCMDVAEGETQCSPNMPAVCVGADKQRKCDGPDMILCDTPSSWGEKPMRCGSNALCEMGLAQGECRVCVTGQEVSQREVTCSSKSELQRCNEDGTGYDLQTCAAGTHCDDAARDCIPDDQVCKPGIYRCEGDTLMQCDADGSQYLEQRVCARGLCQAEGTAGKCMACTPKTTQCAGNLLQRCDDSGAAWEETICEGDTPLCVSGGTCVACTTNTDCALGADQQCYVRGCDTGAGQCEEPQPRLSGDCKLADGSNGVCDGTGACVECRVASHCMTGTCLANRCVECASSRDCRSADKPICDEASNSCVACRQAADCADGCKARICQSGACVAGGSPPTACRLPTGGPGLCLNADECVRCLDDGDCDGGLFCGADHRCVQCTPTKGCPNGTCDSAGNCGGCQNDAQCAGLADGCLAARCGASGSCEFAPLGPNTACTLGTGAAGVCDGDQGMCVRCAGGVGCPDGMRCVGGECVECMGDTDCGGGTACVPRVCVDNMCQPRPLDDGAACEGGNVCVDGECRQCLAADDCAGTADPFCSPAGKCVACIENADCGASSACKAFTCDGGSCVSETLSTCQVEIGAPGVCQSDGACCGDGKLEGMETCDPGLPGWSELSCDPATCQPNLGLPCENSSECAAKLNCVDGMCSARCDPAADCPPAWVDDAPPLTCDNGYCVMPCSNPSQCPWPGMFCVAPVPSAPTVCSWTLPPDPQPDPVP